MTVLIDTNSLLKQTTCLDRFHEAEGDVEFYFTLLWRYPFCPKIRVSSMTSAINFVKCCLMQKSCYPEQAISGYSPHLKSFVASQCRHSLLLSYRKSLDIPYKQERPPLPT